MMREDFLAVQKWAQDILQDGSAIILDTETTGLHGEAIEIAIIDLSGNTLFNRRVKPVYGMEAAAENVHGISLKSLENEPTFDALYPELVSIVAGRTVLIYNYAFDARILRSQCEHYKLTPIANLWGDDSNCVMEPYAQWVGDWSDYHGNYRWQRLPGGNHTALGDCLATLDVIKRMAGIDA